MSEWTVATLKEHFDRILEERGRRYDQRFTDSQTAVGAALNAAKEAVGKAEAASEKRFEGVNEFRNQLGDQARTFMPRLEAEQRMTSIETQIENMARLHSQNVGKAMGSRELWGYIVGVLGVVALIASWMVKAFAKP